MAIGVRGYQVYFLKPPTPAQVLLGLHNLTGLTMGAAVQGERHITRHHPAKPDWCIELDWSADCPEELQRLMEAVPDLPVQPLDTYPYSISLPLNPGPAPRSYQYLETSLLVVFQGLGGQLAEPHPLPIWAGMRWADMLPVGLWETVKDR